jgi:L-serine deaminase
MATRKTNGKSTPKKKKQPTMKELYAKLRREFTAADLQLYTEVEEGIPADKVLAMMRQVHKDTLAAMRKEKR